MVLFNYTTKEITAKIVYYGPGLGGKTTNLQSIYEDLPPEMKGKMLSLATKSDRTLFFDFLPIDLGSIGGMKVRVQLYTVPGQVYYNSTRKLVIKGADGVVFVADSQKAMAEANKESLDNLYQNLAEQNVKLNDICLALQYNKRDLGSVLPVEEMGQQLNRGGWPVFEAVATQGIGVQETLREMLKLVVLSLKEKYDFSVADSALLEELDQAGQALKGSTASTDEPQPAVEETPAVESAITAPLAVPQAGAEPDGSDHQPAHSLSADQHLSDGEDSVAGDNMLELGGPSGIFSDSVVPELDLFELDDEFLDTGDDEPGAFRGAVEDPFGDESVLVIDEEAPDAEFTDGGSGAAAAVAQAKAAAAGKTAVVTAEAEDPFDLLEPAESPEPATADQTVSRADPLVLELTVPQGAEEGEVTVPLTIRLNHMGQPLELQLSLSLRLKG